MLTADQAGKTYVAYGSGVQMFDWLDGGAKPPMEAMFEGVAGCGKTRMIGEWIKCVCALFPKSNGLVLRETRVSLNKTFLPIWQDHVWGPDHPIITDGPTAAHRTEYRHPLLGGTVSLAGFDEPRKLYSSEWDWIYFCEMQETWEEKWMSLHRGLRGRGMPFRILLGDCNPEDEYHWANLRAQEGVLHRIVGQFTDNPLYFNHDTYNELRAQGYSDAAATDKSWTEFGIEYLTRLFTTLSGPILRRLAHGEWVSASGRVWRPWDPRVHMIAATLEREDGDHIFLRVPKWDRVDEDTGEEIPCRRRLHKFFGAADIGHEEPGVAQVWGLDADDRMYMVAEVYKTRHDHRQWADFWAELMEEFPIRFILTDHDHDYVSALNHKLRRHESGKPIARFWSKSRGVTNEKAGIDEARQRMKERPDGSRGLYLLKDCLRYGADEDLVNRRVPWRTDMEVGSYVYPKPEPGKLIPHGGEIPDPRCIDHGCDTLRGACTWNRDHSKVRIESPRHWPEGSLNDKLGLNEQFKRWGIPTRGQG